MTLTDVPLVLIDFQERRFSFSRGGSLDELVRSIRTSGLLVPPDLLHEDGRYVIVRGLRRLQALKRLRRRKVRARVFETGEISPLEAWCANFFENRSLRELNRAEACTALRQLNDLGLAAERIRTDYAPLLGLPPRGEELDSLLAVAGLPEKMLDALAEGRMTLASSSFLARMEAKERNSAFRFLEKAGLTVSQQREWTRLVGDLALRDGKSVSRVLLSVSRTAARRGGRFGEGAMQVLRERRYPALAARRRAFRKLLRGLRLPPNVQITAHPTFERRGLTVRFSAATPEEYASLLRLLERVGSDPSVVGLLDEGEGGKQR